MRGWEHASPDAFASGERELISRDDETRHARLTLLELAQCENASKYDPAQKGSHVIGCMEKSISLVGGARIAQNVIPPNSDIS